MSTNETKITLGKQIKHLLEINGYSNSKEKLCEELGIKPTSLQKYLTDNRRPTLEDIVKLANYFNTSVDYVVGNSKYIMDTWDHDFLNEFFAFCEEKIGFHYSDRLDIHIVEEGTLYTVLFGLLTYVNFSKSEKVFEDLTKEEQVQLIEKFDLIISILKNCIQLTKKEKHDLEMLRKINNNVKGIVIGVSETRPQTSLNDIEQRTDLSREDKVELLKSYLNENAANTQKALRILEELS